VLFVIVDRNALAANRVFPGAGNAVMSISQAIAERAAAPSYRIGSQLKKR
jgi:hypothetical protein